MDIEKYKTLDKEQLKAMVLLRQKIEQEGARTNFMRFVKAVWPEFVEGPHHLRTSEKFQKFSTDKACRLIINMPPRHTKSEFASYLFPAWMMGLNPKLKIIQATHTGELAVRFGRKIRNLMNTKEYKRIFPGVTLRTDNQAAGRWETNHGGEYFAAGVGGAITGRGADLLIIDDPHSEQDALSETAMDNAYEWYTSGPRQRLQPGGSIAIVMTRWSQKDLTAQLVRILGSLLPSEPVIGKFTMSSESSSWAALHLNSGRLKPGLQRTCGQHSLRATSYERTFRRPSEVHIFVHYFAYLGDHCRLRTVTVVIRAEI